MKLLLHENRWRGGSTVLALGTFDGLHLGHAALIREACAIAKGQALQSIVFTFRDHPLAVLHPEKMPPQLSTPEEKVSGIAALGPDALVMRHFDRGFATMSDEAFASHLVRTLCPRHVVVGFNYSFGAGGHGNAERLQQFGERFGFAVRVMGPVCSDGKPVSSTRVRNTLTLGRMEEVRALLGHDYLLEGQVQTGKQLGRTLGFPTANLALPQRKALPPYGVYAAWARTRGTWYRAVINIGAHPTVPEGGATIEVHLMDACLDLYGQRMQVTLHEFLRPEYRFDNLGALRAQIAQDVRNARASLAGNR